MFPVEIDPSQPTKYVIRKRQIGRNSTYPVLSIRETKLYVIAQYRVPATGHGGELKFSKRTHQAVGCEKPTARRTWYLSEVA